MLFGSPSSKSILHGFRSPIAQISPLDPDSPTNGLSLGMAYSNPASLLFTSMRISFPNKVALKAVLYKKPFL